MRGFLAPMLGMAAVAALAACAPMKWERPGTTAEAATQDMQECRTIARTQAQHVGFRRSLFWPGMWHRRGLYGFDPFFDDPFYDTFYIEQDLKDSCLRAKGYNLVPAEPG